MPQEILGGERTLETMSFEELENDPRYGDALQKAALEYLRKEDAEYFEREFNGELDSDGYLMKKDGTNSNTKPSMNIGGGSAMEKVVEMTRKMIASQPSI